MARDLGLIRKISKHRRGFYFLSNNKGTLFVLTYLVTSVFIILMTAFWGMSMTEKKVSERENRHLQAIHLAEAGIDRTLYHLHEDFDGDGSWTDGAINGIAITPDSSAYTNFLTSVALGSGSYTSALKTSASSQRHMYVRSTGTVGDVSRTVEVYMRMRSDSPWDYAIFSGSGASGRAINGSTDVRGSVHILGTGLTSTDTAMDLGGSAKIGNNYSGMSAALTAKIPSLPSAVHNGELVSSLESELRIKTGRLGLSGSATAGEADVAGNSVKETLDGVYVTDGYTGNQGASSVYSDNGTANVYDLGDSLTFPSLASPYGAYSSYQAYLQANALVLASGLSITPTSSFSYSNSNGSISMDGSGNLEIDGIVFLPGGTSTGNLSMSKVGSNKTINYTGSGSLLVTGNVNIDVNLYSSGNSSYPTNILGVMTPNSITFNEANIDVMGIFYGESTVTVAKQTNVVGSIVTNYFDLGANVPTIYHVPAVADNLPPGMITTTPTWTIDIVSWQEI